MSIMYSYNTHNIVIILLLALASAQRPSSTCTAVQPSSSRCNIRGASKRHTDSANPLTVPTIEDCAEICFRHGTNVTRPPHDAKYSCYAFQYDTSTNLCRILLPPIEPKNYEIQPNGTTVINKLGCYDCGAICDQPIGANVVDNSGFELSSTLLGPWATAGTITTPGYNSPQAWFANQTGNYIIDLVQSYNSCKGHTYKIQAKYKINPLSKDGATLAYGDICENTYSRPFLLGSSAAGTWQNFTTFCGAFSSGGQILFTTSQAESYLDDVQVTRISSDLETKKLPEPAFENGGFESGSLEPWKVGYPLGKKGTPVKVVSPGLSGKYGLYWNTTLGDGFTLATTIKMTPGINYVFKFDYQRRSVPPSAYCALQTSLKWLDDDGWEVDATGGQALHPSGTHETLVSGDIGTSSFKVYFDACARGMTSHGTIYLDNFSLERLVE